MNKIFLLSTVCVVILSGCSSLNNQDDFVSRNEYESIVSEVDELKTQIESIENQSNYNIETHSYIENDDQESENQNVYEKELFDECTFEWDENNQLYLAIYKEGGKKFSLVGSGIYEDENLGLLQEDYFIISSYSGIWLSNIEINFKIGEEEYLYLKTDGEFITDSVPMAERENIQQKYDVDERRSEISFFYNSIFDKIAELTD